MTEQITKEELQEHLKALNIGIAVGYMTALEVLNTERLRHKNGSSGAATLDRLTETIQEKLNNLKDVEHVK